MRAPFSCEGVDAPRKLPLLIAFKERACVFKADSVGNILPEFPREKVVEITHLLRRAKPFGNIATIVIASQSQNMLSAKFEKMVYVAKHIVMRHMAGFAQEALAVVQSD